MNSPIVLLQKKRRKWCRQVFFFAVVATMVTMPLAVAFGAKPDGAPQDPWLPTSTSMYTTKNVDWTLTMRRDVTTADSPLLKSYLQNHSSRRFVFSTDHNEGDLLLVLKPQGEKAIVRSVDWKKGLRQLTYNRLPNFLDTIHSITIDLRWYFGKLEPGEYNLHLVWKSKGYSIAGLPGHKSQDLLSPKLSFRVRKTNLASANKSFKQQPIITPIMITRDQKAVSIAQGRQTTATLTNHHKFPIHIAYDPVQDKNGIPIAKQPPLHTKIGLMRWHPVHGWREIEQIKLSSNNPPYYTIPPGKSVKLSLPDWLIESAGIYGYSLYVYKGDVSQVLHDKPLSFAGQVHCQGFEITQKFVDKSIGRVPKSVQRR